MIISPVSCCIIDDEPLAIGLLEKYIRDHNSLRLVCSFDDSMAAKDFLKANPVDLLFSDINMPHLSGLDLVRTISGNPMLIFTTAYSQFAAEGFELDAVDYLVKPISKERFEKAVRKAIDFFNYKKQSAQIQSEYIFVYCEYRLLKIPIADIVYIESLEDYIKIHFVSGKPVMTLMTLKAVLGKLPSSQFRRIHRSYIIAFSKIKSILNKKVMLSTGIELPVSDTFISVIKDWKEGN